MSELDLLIAIPTLAIDVFTPGKGHFYYSANDATGKARRAALASDLYALGLR